MMKPSGVAMKPEPLPAWRPSRRTSMPTTDAETRSTTEMTVAEYWSSTSSRRSLEMVCDMVLPFDRLVPHNGCRDGYSFVCIAGSLAHGAAGIAKVAAK